MTQNIRTDFFILDQFYLTISGYCDACNETIFVFHNFLQYIFKGLESIEIPIGKMGIKNLFFKVNRNIAKTLASISVTNDCSFCLLASLGDVYKYDINKEYNLVRHTLSIPMICNFCGKSAILAGNLDLPDTNLRNNTLSSLPRDSRISHNQTTDVLVDFNSRYL